MGLLNVQTHNHGEKDKTLYRVDPKVACNRKKGLTGLFKLGALLHKQHMAQHGPHGVTSDGNTDGNDIKQRKKITYFYLSPAIVRIAGVAYTYNNVCVCYT